MGGRSRGSETTSTVARHRFLGSPLPPNTSYSHDTCEPATHSLQACESSVEREVASKAMRPDRPLPARRQAGLRQEDPRLGIDGAEACHHDLPSRVIDRIEPLKEGGADETADGEA